MFVTSSKTLVTADFSLNSSTLFHYDVKIALYSKKRLRFTSTGNNEGYDVKSISPDELNAKGVQYFLPMAEWEKKTINHVYQ
jgi:hypothetical protein